MHDPQASERPTRPLIRSVTLLFVQGIFSWLCLCRLAVAGGRAFGSATQASFLLLSCLQFHIPFYASRTLPNVFAFGPVVLAFAHWLDGTEIWLAPALLTAVTIITRCDMLLLVACVSLALLATRRMPLLRLVMIGVSSAAAALVATVAFDSFVWGRPLWPEGEVLWFNTVLNKCGTMRLLVKFCLHTFACVAAPHWLLLTVAFVQLIMQLCFPGHCSSGLLALHDPDGNENGSDSAALIARRSCCYIMSVLTLLSAHLLSRIGYRTSLANVCAIIAVLLAARNRHQAKLTSAVQE